MGRSGRLVCIKEGAPLTPRLIIPIGTEGETAIDAIALFNIDS